ncbi:response regulator transcription factor [Paenibacillus sp.]|uniref:response regulator transcription factor n=1 Tax=Paenibacillus sp. TaxID=58172 RepID=UPI002D5980BB|nr:response regulator [Paenibacillus sp.]HZG58819.1 response regulator [Paenibacillus sp.]
MVSVLIVDDHKHLVEWLIADMPWQELGISGVFGAHSGTEALEAIRRERIDVLIADIRMPGMSGIELIEAARRERPRLESILLTGHAEFEYAVKAVELRAYRYLLKPVRTDELSACLRSLLAERNAAPDVGGPEIPEPVEEAPERGAHYGKIVEAVDSYVDTHIGEDLTLAAIAAHVHLHPVYLSKVYKETSGRNLSETILQARMRRAKELLSSTPMKIYEIAEAVGYRSAQHFITEFRRAVGMTPKAYQTLKR